jgi:hypothetical protein
MITENEIAYKIYEWRIKRGVHGDPDRDYRCASYIKRVERDIPNSNDRLGWEILFEYHYG